MKRYWLQGDYEGASIKGLKVYLKTDNLNQAINKMKRMVKEVFVWDCINRLVIDANYNCKIYNNN